MGLEKEVNIADLMVKFYLLILRNFWIVALCGLLGFGFGVYKRYFSPLIYKTNLIANSSVVSGYRMADIVSSMDVYLKDDNHQGLADAMQISVNAAKSLKSISGVPHDYDIDVTDVHKRGIFELNCFKIKLEAYSHDYLDEVRSGFDNFIANHEYVKGRVERQRAMIAQTIAKFEEEIKELDEYQVSVREQMGGNAKAIISNSEKVSQLDMINLYEEKNRYTETLELTRPMIVLKDFVPIRNPEREPWIMSILYLLVGAILGVFISLIKEVRKRSKQYLAANQ